MISKYCLVHEHRMNGSAVSLLIEDIFGIHPIDTYFYEIDIVGKVLFLLQFFFLLKQEYFSGIIFVVSFKIKDLRMFLFFLRQS